MVAVPKQITPRSEAYLEFIRGRPCVITGRSGVHAHHVKIYGSGGMSLKPSDYLCVPLCHEEHSALHQMGEKTYWARQQIDPGFLICRQLLLYALSQSDPREVIELLETFVERKRGKV